MITRLRAERERLGLSQTALAARAERLSASDISRFEHRWARPYPAQARRLGRVLNLDPATLLELVEAEPDRAASGEGLKW